MLDEREELNDETFPLLLKATPLPTAFATGSRSRKAGGLTHDLLRQEGMVRHLPLRAGAEMNTALRNPQFGRQKRHRNTTGFEGTTAM